MEDGKGSGEETVKRGTSRSACPETGFTSGVRQNSLWTRNPTRSLDPLPPARPRLRSVHPPREWVGQGGPSSRTPGSTCASHCRTSTGGATGS